MTSNDFYLLSPELSLIAVSMALLILDLFVSKKRVLHLIGFFALVIPLGFSLSLWMDLNPDNVTKSNVVVSGVLQIDVLETLIVDKFSLFFKFLIIGVTALIFLVSGRYANKFSDFRIEYYSLVLFSATGMMLMASALELITLYVALELSAIPLAILAAFGRGNLSSESGIKFLIISGMSSAFLLYGMVLIYGFTGTTSIQEIGVQLTNISLDASQSFGSHILLFAVVLIIAGFGFKITAFPFHMWAPDVYQGAPTPITAFLSVASKAAGFAVILRVFYVSFPISILSFEWSIIFAIISVFSMTIGNFAAIAQSNIKRMLAYSTIAHAGYIMVGLAAVAVRTTGENAVAGPSGVLFYLAGYVVMNMAAFSAVIAITNRTASDDIYDLAGMAKTSPYLAGALAFSMLSLIGIPPTVGFIAKIYIFSSAMNAGLIWLVVAGVLNSVVSVYYYLRVVKVMYLSPPPEEQIDIVVDIPIKLALISTIGAVLIFGIYPKWLFEIARSVAQVLLVQ